MCISRIIYKVMQAYLSINFLYIINKKLLGKYNKVTKQNN